jgi:hypothetical protein
MNSDDHLSPRELQEILAAQRLGLPFLLWRDQDRQQQLLTLQPDWPRVVIGRDRGLDVSLDWDLEVSRTHALLELIGNGWTLVDAGSRNGSFVNGAKLSGRHQLTEKDQLRLGVTKLTYRAPPPPEPSSPEPSPAGTTIVPPKPVPPPVPLPPMRRKVLIALCRPIHDKKSTIPATNSQIAQEVFLGVDAVKGHLRVLFEAYSIGDVAQNEKRARLAQLALESGQLTDHDFDEGGPAG